MYYVYILQNGRGKYYIGCTGNIELRLRQHNQNCVTATKNRGPYKLIYKEEFTDKTLALQRENKLKSFKGNSVFKRLLVESSTPSSSLV